MTIDDVRHMPIVLNQPKSGTARALLALADVAAAAASVRAFSTPDSVADQVTDAHLRASAREARTELDWAFAHLEMLQP